MSPRGLVRSLQKTPITRLSIQVKFLNFTVLHWTFTFFFFIYIYIFIHRKVIDKMDHMSSLVNRSSLLLLLLLGLHFWDHWAQFNSHSTSLWFSMVSFSATNMRTRVCVCVGLVLWPLVNHSRISWSSVTWEQCQANLCKVVNFSGPK